MNAAAREYSHISAAIYGQPWAITEEWLNNICTIAETRFGVPPLGGSAEFESRIQSPAPVDPDDLPFDFTRNVAIIPVSGPIFPKANLFTRISGATSLDTLKSNLQFAAELDPSAIVMNMDSPGGSVAGLADFCEWLHQFCAAAGYPVIALCNPLAASAAYMIASQCDACLSTSGGFSGSIGVVARMDNYDRAERNEGNDPIVLRTHELKGIGAGPVTPNQTGELQRMMMSHFGKFKEAVARGRPQVNLDQVATGQVWMGQPAGDEPSAFDMDLIDGITTLEKLIEDYGTD